MRVLVDMLQAGSPRVPAGSTGITAFLLIPAIVGWAAATFVAGPIGLPASRRHAS